MERIPRPELPDSAEPGSIERARNTVDMEEYHGIESHRSIIREGKESKKTEEVTSPGVERGIQGASAVAVTLGY
jgi:hypothetical protein